MEAVAAARKAATRRAGATAVHSLDRFVFSVPDLDVAERFYSQFGLDARRSGDRLDLYAFGHPHCWGTIVAAPGRKKLQYLTFGAYAEDMDALAARAQKLGVARAGPHPLADREGIWLSDPDGNAVQIVAAAKVSPEGPPPQAAPALHPRGKGAAPGRSAAGPVRPKRLSHALIFSSDVLRSVRFYADALGLRLSDHAGDIVAFMHGAHASDHHMLAFAKSGGPGFHHSSWQVDSIDEVGIGMDTMIGHGHTRGWGVGRHVIGSNYFAYVQDPWGSFAEYSYDIDFVPADLDWKAADHAPEDSFYVWGPPPPDYFIVNHEIAG
jgi:catechol 2,3-dioxygenase-like lactoylglutathione lyase family enzyme